MAAITRVEHDSLGEVVVPAEAYWGAQTARAVANFPISGKTLSSYPALLRALAMVKQAAALANGKIGRLPDVKRDAIVAAAKAVVAGQLHDQFPIDVIQGGAGTSTNMNMNEVLANRGLEIMGFSRGDYAHLHPNDDVNFSQSTNDAYPSAVRLAILLQIGPLQMALERLAAAFSERGTAFADVVKLGRTQLQDAVPMTLGQEFEAFAFTIREDVMRVGEASLLLREINLGGTAIGTGINADPDYGPLVIEALSDICGIPLVRSANLIEASWDMGAFVMISGVLKRVATKLSKIANDLRLLSSGPRGGIGEITLPAVQPGSSIMPGKINPVIPEVVNQVCFQVIGNDLAITMAAEGGQLQLNAFEPLIAHNLLTSIELLTNAATTFETRCVAGIEARPEVCAAHMEASVGSATALVPVLGYETAARIAKEALASGRTVRELAAAAGLSDEEVTRILSPDRLALARRDDWKKAVARTPDPES
jgi:aspartate ammonia-lyase